MRAFLLMLGLSSSAVSSIAHAQFRMSDVTLGDVERAVRIVRTVADISRSGRSPSRSGRTTGRTSGRSTSGTTSTGASRAAATATLRTADQYVGVPYLWGGSTPSGFDCSGFIQFAYRKHGVELPRTSRQMANAGRPVPPYVDQLEPGDLMLFHGSKGVIGHVALYAGDGRILHSSSSGNGVRYDDLTSKRGRYYVSHLVVARRVTEDGRSLVQSLGFLTRKVPFDYFDPPDNAPKRH